MTNEEHYRKLERLHAAAPVSQRCGATITIADGHAEMRLVTRPEFYHAANLLGHGSGVFTRSAISLDRGIGYA